MRLADWIRDRKLWLLVLTSLLALVLGFVAIKGNAAIQVVGRGGYWFVLVTFLLWGWSLWQCFGESLRALRWRTLDYKMHGLVAACGTLLLTHEPFGFKILMDEILLLSTSMSMHLNRIATAADRGNDINGVFALMGGILDKRPLFHPFLLSLVHDLTGYRPENAFILNAVLLFVFLAMLAKLGSLLAGRTGGALCVILFTGLPLLAQNATGGGFELLNLVMALALMLIAVRWVQRPDGATLTALCFTAILLVQIRYESVLLAAPVALVVLLVWVKQQRIILDWRVIFAPLLLVPFALHHQVFQLRPGAYQLFSKPGYEKPFSLAYIPDNLGHAFAFFFGAPGDHSNSPLLAGLGFLMLPLALLALVAGVRKWRELDAHLLALGVFFLGLSAHFLLLMSYFWGQFDDTIIRRLSLPSHLWLVLALLLGLSMVKQARRLYVVLAVAGAFYVLGVAVPAMSSQSYMQLFTPARETAWRRAFMAEFPAKDYLVVDNDSYIWISHKVSATTAGQAKARKDAMIYHMRNHTFSRFYVFQHFDVDPETGKLAIVPEEDLGPDFELVPYREERFAVLKLCRMSEIVAVREGDKVQRLTSPTAEAALPRDPAEVDRRRYQYLENYIKQLP
jgi:hypothetical protein